jgi:hypothetical protein
VRRSLSESQAQVPRRPPGEPTGQPGVTAWPSATSATCVCATMEGAGRLAGRGARRAADSLARQARTPQGAPMVWYGAPPTPHQRQRLC